MKRIKSLFSTPKKTVICVVCIVAILAVIGTVTAFAVRSIAESSAIGAENAQNFAFVDAGVDPVSAENVNTRFDFEDGQFVYEVEFVADGTEYEYLINASDGTVVKKETEAVDDMNEASAVTAKISLEEAKSKALSDAGLSESGVKFTKAKADFDDEIAVYDIEFISGNIEYEYEINAETGAVYSKSKEAVEKDDTSSQPKTKATEPKATLAKATEKSRQSATQAQPSGSGVIGVSAAKKKALADAGVSSSAVTFTKAKLDYDDGVQAYEIEFFTSTHEYEYEINAKTGAVISKDAEARKTAKTNATESAHSSASYIGEDKAKSIALSHSGLSAAEAVFKKVKLERDDGVMVYELEFYGNGTEYEYQINATSGRIIEHDSETDDDD